MNFIHKNFPPKLFSSFSVWIIISITISLYIRSVELISILQYHQFFEGVIKNTLLGVGNDMCILSLFLLILFPVYWLLYRFTKFASLFFLIIFSILILFHILILQYYAYMLTPLSEFFWAYFPHDVIFTVRSSNVRYFFPVIYCILGLIMLFLCYFILRKRVLKKYSVYILLCVNIFFLVSYIYKHHYFSRIDEKQIPYSIITNKSHYFYKKTAKHFFVKNQTNTIINDEERAKLFPHKIFFDKEYPLLSITNYEDLLSSYFYPAAENPNIVIIIVEGLGERFMEKYRGIDLMPFLSGLAEQSLYWKNFVTTAERSFGVLSSVLSSAPYGEKGFVFLENDTTSLSLTNLLSAHGYYSTFFYGQPDWFHNSGPYLRRNKINRIEHAYTYPEKYSKIMVGDYFWGYNDKDLISYMLEVIDSLPQTSRLDIVYTGSMHSPFIISQPELYAARLQKLMAENVSDEKDLAFLNQYATYFETILFTDDAIKNLFSGYKQHAHYENTIFIITGDHGMSEIPNENVFTQYNTPLIIYSPRLKKPEIFLSINSHLDITPSVLTFLQTQHHIPMPKTNAFIGKSLDTCKSFRCLQPVVFMNDDRQIESILYDKYFIINNNLYQLNEKAVPCAISNDGLKKEMLTLLQNFIAINNFVYLNNRLVPIDVYVQEIQ